MRIEKQRYARQDSNQIGTSPIFNTGTNPITLRTGDGTVLNFQLINGEYRCTQVKDSNGNYITVNRDASSGRITTIIDTLARTITFAYSNNNLQKVTQLWNGVEHILAEFEYSSLTIQTNFTGLSVVGPQNNTSITVLHKVTLDGSSFDFEYNTYGQVRRVNHKAPDQHLLAYAAYDLLASGDCVYWFEGQAHKVGHPARLPDLLKTTGLNFYLSGDDVSLGSLPTKPTPLDTNAFGARGHAVAQTLGRGTSNVQIVFNRSSFADFNNARLAEELIHEMFHAAGLHGSAPKGGGLFGWRRANDLNPEVKWDDIRQHCGQYIK